MFGEVFHFQGPAEHVPVDYEELIADTTAIALTVSKAARSSMVLVQLSGGPARVLFAGPTVGAPTASFGYLVWDGQTMTLTNRTALQLRVIKSDQPGAIASTLRAIYCLWDGGYGP
jgi:hypothetical protein